MWKWGMYMNMLQVAVLGVAGVLLAVQFKGGKTEYSPGGAPSF